MSKIVVLKSITGDEIIATKVGNENVYEKVRVFRIMPDSQAGLIPFIMVAPDATISINMALILTEIPAPQNIEKAYLEATTDFVIAR
jgi:hypothetical protein